MPRRGDAGFTLTEVIVAMAIFTIVVAVTLSLTIGINSASQANQARVVAAELANRRLEAIRGTNAEALTDGFTVTTESVSGLDFVLAENVTYAAYGSQASICASNAGDLSFKLVTVQVLWDGMGQAAPVRVDTLKALGVSGADSDLSTGVLAVSVLGAKGEPMSGVTLTLDPGGDSMMTGDDGCAVFAGLAPGQYTASADQDGLVGVDGLQLARTGAVGVNAAQISRVSLTYDHARTVELTNPAPGFSYPQGVPLLFRSAYQSEQEIQSCAAGVGTCVDDFPGMVRQAFPADYEFWLGSCPSAHQPTVVDLTDPANDGASVPLASGAVVVGVQVGGVSTAGLPIYASHDPETAQSGSSCPAGKIYSLPQSEVGGVGVLLPYGTWTLSVTSPAGPEAVTVDLTDSVPVSAILAAG